MQTYYYKLVRPEGIEFVYNVNPQISANDQPNSVNFDGPEGMRDDISAKSRFLVSGIRMNF